MERLSKILHVVLLERRGKHPKGEMKLSEAGERGSNFAQLCYVLERFPGCTRTTVRHPSSEDLGEYSISCNLTKTLFRQIEISGTIFVSDRPWYSRRRNLNSHGVTNAKAKYESFALVNLSLSPCKRVVVLSSCDRDAYSQSDLRDTKIR